ncbi:MAG: hypothetical protein HQL68_09740 [Magnetococcales bacterium]|nr:hypothetical protein [Magnetococcales bacterium]
MKENDQPGSNRATHNLRHQPRRLNSSDNIANPVFSQPKLNTKPEVVERAKFYLKKAELLFLCATTMED